MLRGICGHLEPRAEGHTTSNVLYKGNPSRLSRVYFRGGARGAFAPPQELVELTYLILAMHTETKAIVGCIIYHWVV